HAPQFEFGCPFRPLVPTPAREAHGGELRLHRLYFLKELTDLRPALPIVPEVGDAVAVPVAICARPGERCFSGRGVGLDNRGRIEAVKQKRANLRSARL